MANLNYTDLFQPTTTTKYEYFLMNILNKSTLISHFDA